MITGESAADDKPCADTTVLRFKIDGMQSTIEQLKVKVAEASEAAMRGFRAAMKAVGMRGPDPDYDPQDDDIRRLAGIIERLAQRPNHYSNGPADESNWRTIALFVMGFLQALILAFMGYIYSATSQTHDDVIRIKCRLDPQSCMGSPSNVVRP